MIRWAKRTPLFMAAMVLALGGLTPSGANAQARNNPVHSIRLEGGVSFMLSNPHRDLYGIGGGGGVGYEFRVHDYVGIEAHFGAYVFSSADPIVELGTYFAPSLGVRFHPLPELEVMDLYLAGRGALVLTGEVTRFGIEADLGAEFPIGELFRVGPFVRYVHVFQPDANELGPANGQYIAAGLTGTIAFGENNDPTDDDGDGIFSDVDRCPDEAEDMDAFQDDDGCPEIDNDHDGVEDGSDNCPTVSEDIDGFEDEDGCPDSDNDGDSIGDLTDACPNHAEDLDGDRDTDGCPDEDGAPVDADGDGVPDAEDQCNGEIEDMDGFEDTDGCPDPDNDRDGILDADDECPLAPASEGSDNGCPATVRITGSGLRILQRIEFQSDSSRLLRRSEAVLAEVAGVLNANPQMFVRIEGHADNRASEESNLRLSQQRAEMVRDWLVEHGINATRLEAIGFGESRPRNRADTDEAHRSNRRVEFVLQPR